MERWRKALGRLRGWRRQLVAVLCGALATLALPPFYLVPALVPALTALIWLIAASRRPRGAFAVGWWFGFGHFLTGFYWIAHAFAVAGVAPWAAPFAVLALAAAAALFIAAAAALTHAAGVVGPPRVLLFATAWTAAEWARSFLILGGFPWNLIGYCWVFSDAMSQFAALGGVLGLSLVTVAAAAAPAVAGDSRPRGPGSRWRGWRPSLIAAAGLAVIWAGGELRLAGASGDEVPGVRLRLVQADVAQYHKWRDDLRASLFARHLEMSKTAAAAPVTDIIWPETATPYPLAQARGVRDMIARVVPPGGLLITGAIRATPPGAKPVQVWNSLAAIDDTGKLVAVYDKARLVPFGEYVPLRRFLPLRKLTHGSIDFSSGPGRRTLHLPGLPPVSPLICYEAVFPGRVLDPADRPGWLLNITNDAWYGLTTGPYQHMAQARLRAVEEGLPLVRAANTGISAVVDPYGRVIAKLGLGERGVLDSRLPAALPGGTPYGRYRDWPLAFVLALIAAWAIRSRRPAR